MKPRNKIFSLVTLLGLLLQSFAIISPSANAVVNGEEISDAATSKPWVAQIWYAESAEYYYEPEFICTGSLITSDKILTAAHCVLDEGFYFVKLAANTIEDESPLLEVNAAWRNPRYSAKKIVNDIGILKLTKPVTDVAPIALPTTSMSAKINKLKKYTLYGWGVDQNGDDATFLKTASIANQDAAAKKSMSKYGYSSTTMLAAGNYIKSEKIYAGACNGDSGGPLTSVVDGIEVIIGVTSWGMRECDLGRPSIFSRVTYFLKDIKSGVAVSTQAATSVNRAAPSYTVKPSISGSARVGSVITCETGTWSENTTSIRFKWTAPYNAVGITSKSIQLGASNAGQTFTCEVSGSSRTATLPVSVSVSVPNKPIIKTNPVITGMTGTSYSSYARLGTSLTCGGIEWSNDVESTTTAWYTSSSSYSFDPAKSTVVGSSSSLYLSEAVLRSLFGKYLYCTSTGINGGGQTVAYDYEYISTPSAPYSASASISGITYGSAPTIGTVATCSGSSSSNYDFMNYEWGVGTSSYSSYTSPLSTSLGGGNTLTLTKSIIDQIKGKYLVCVVTVTNLSGSTSGYDTEFITAPAQTAPGVPTISSVVAVDTNTATVTFAAPESDGWSSIQSYTITSTPSSKTITVNQAGGGAVTFTGLTPGATYTFTARATNAIGASSWATASAPLVMPSNVTTP
jgi:secreted trypsin-like serine protease